MIQKFLLPAVLSGLLGSCGPSNELQLATAQVQQMQANNQALTKNVDDLKKQVADLNVGNTSLSGQLNECQGKVAETELRLRGLRNVLKEESDNLHKVQQKIDEGMADFQSKGVEIVYKNGLLYVSMAEGLLYKSGSAVLSDSGKMALNNLATVLNSYPKLKVIVLGNTDDKMFKKGSDNWTLSTERANGVVRVLRDASVDPARLTSAGKGKYGPVADNSTVEGRAKNRRTDIILNPDLDRLWNSVQQEQ
jgi:chemotaxis protein MotB